LLGDLGISDVLKGDCTLFTGLGGKGTLAAVPGLANPFVLIGTGFLVGLKLGGVANPGGGLEALMVFPDGTLLCCCCCRFSTSLRRLFLGLPVSAAGVVPLLEFAAASFSAFSPCALVPAPGLIVPKSHRCSEEGLGFSISLRSSSSLS
jgi:hypothetical protein